MIQISGLEKYYTMSHEKLLVLALEHLQVAKGEQAAVTGPSGCGKSTLLHMVGGVVVPEQGSIVVDGADITCKNEKERDAYRARQVGYIFQDFYLIPSMTAEENVRLVLPAMRKQEQTALLDEWFEKVGLSERRNHRPGQMSRGQQQRVAIIRALINKPSVVLADEPTGSLDYETAGMMMDLLLGLCKANGQTLLCVTHDLPLAERFPRVIRMQECNKAVQDRRVIA
ncbi:ABC transporter ATP-binding protein [Paenibacillus xerothermodurans]|uniref:ABC transporter ATP-binding protein n=1 Tax=Paenibacillus xerothermodurans TaxID=1977292 RepID=A0A2W1NZ96_PAEXE|nr:ABC transporter ATP-binding protein [Paenibacillus xerothermodurans]PZE20842.1 ABC transporter ATP-binding protein [Paenibacillus xerothermodurans]